MRESECVGGVGWGGTYFFARARHLVIPAKVVFVFCFGVFILFGLG